MTNKTFDELLQESFSNASYMDVRELRALYYGRSNVYVSFSDDGEYLTAGYVAGRLERPAGILAHTVDVVVGRKASTSMFYGNVFRRRSTTGFLDDIRNHSKEDYARDVEAFLVLGYIKDDRKEQAVEAASSPRLRSSFERLWVLTRTAAGSKSGSDRLWARILMDIGYMGFTDNSGTGILVKERVPCSIFLDERNKTDFDIVPVQKYRRDPRRRITDKVERKVEKMSTRRNRVAKQKVTRFDAPETVTGSVKSIIRNLTGRL